MAIRELKTFFTANTGGMKKAMSEIRTDLQNVSAAAETAAKQTQKSWENAGKKMQTAGKLMSAAVTVPLLAAGTAGTKFAIDQEKSFNKVSTLLDEGTTDFKKYKDDIRNGSSEMGVAFDEYSESVYGSISAGIDAADAVDFTAKAVKLAKGGFTDTATAVDVMTTAINAYGLEAEDADRISDMLINTQNLGKTTVDELASSMGAVIPTANAQNVSLEQLSTGYAVLTKNGIATSEAGTYMKAMFGELGKSGSQTDKILREKLGKSFAELSAEGMNTGEILNVLKDEAEGSGQSLSDLFGSSEAGAAALTLIKDGGDDFNDTLASMGDVAGATDEAFEKMENSAGVKLANAFNALKNSAAEFGDMVLPVIATLAEYLAKVAGRISDLGPSAKWFIMIAGLIAAAIGPVLLALGSVAMALAPLMGHIKRLGGVMKVLRLAFIAMTGPVGLTIAALVAIGAIFIVLYKRSETFRNGIKLAGEKIKEFAEKAKLAFDALKALFSGDAAQGASLMKAMGLSDEMIVNVLKTFRILRETAKKVFDNIQQFVGDALGKIKGFWDSDGAQIMSAAENVFGFLKKGAEILASVLGAAFKAIFAVIKFIMPAVLGIIKMVWGNIMGVITGALDFIMGAVKVFSGLFTGDFGKMWEGLKQMFFGAIRFIWNLVQLTFFGRIAKGAAVFIGGFRAVFVNLWKFLIGLFTRSVTAVYTSVARNFNLILSTTRGIFNNMWSFLRNIFTTIRDFLGRTSGNIYTTVRNAFQNLGTRTADIFRGIYNGIKKRFTDIVNLAKGLPKRIGDGIGSMASKVTAGVTKVINNLARTLGKGVNGVITGINWVLGKIGVGKDSNIPKWDVPQYAQGTKGAHPGGPAIVGDGKGANSGPELIEHPDGSTYLSPSKDTLVNLPKGAKVWSAKVTKEIFGGLPRYALGDKIRSAADWTKDKASHVWGKTKEVGGKIASAAFDVFDYLKNPSGLLDVAFKALGIEKPVGGNFAGNMASGAFKKALSGAVGFVKGKLAGMENEKGQGFGSAFRKTSSYGRRTHPITKKPGEMHWGDDYGAPAGTPIPSQAAGQVTFAGYHNLRGNYVKIKSGEFERLYQHNARNLVGVGDFVKKGQTVGTVGSTGASTGPHLHYEVKKNGQYIKPNGFADGGIVDTAQLAWIAEGGWAESIISHDPAKKTSQKAIWEKTGEELGFGRSGSEQNKAMTDLLARIAEAVENGHGHDVLLNGRSVGTLIEPHVTNRQQLNKNVKKEFGK